MTKYTFFSAQDDAEAARAGTPETDEWRNFFAKPHVDAMDPVVQGATLLSLLTNHAYDEIVADPSWTRLVSDPEREGVWVMSVPQLFVDTLADATPEQLAGVVGPWLETEEFLGRGDHEQTLSMLTELRELARTTRDSGTFLYVVAML